MLLIIKPNTQNYTNKDFNHETENKATPVGSTALTIILLQNSATFIASVFQNFTYLSAI